MNYKSMLLGLMATVAVFQSQPAQACTGITLTTKDSTRILARTIEWGGSDLNSCYVVVPRGYTVQSYVPGGQDGMMPPDRQEQGAHPSFDGQEPPEDMTPPDGFDPTQEGKTPPGGFGGFDPKANTGNA